MFRRDKSITLKGSASAICNNLSVHLNLQKNQILYAVAHKTVIDLVHAATDGVTVNHKQIVNKEPNGQPTMIIGCKILPFVAPGKGKDHRTILVMTSAKGIMMFDADSGAMLTFYAIAVALKDDDKAAAAQKADPKAGGKPVYCRGIAGVRDMVCVGTSEGNILVFHIAHNLKNVTLNETLKGHHHQPISDMDCSHSFLVSSDESGDIMIWKVPMKESEQFTTVKRIKGKGPPCSSVRIWNDIVVGGFADGQVRLYKCPSGKLWAEIAAHGKWINAIDVSSAGKLMTAGEDAYVHIWKLTKGAEPTISHVHTECVTDLQLQGAAFVHPEGHAFGVTGYDWNEIVFYTKAG